MLKLLLVILGLSGPVFAQNNQPLPGQLGMIATGSNQASALQLPAQLNVFKSVPVGSGARPPSLPTSVTVVNTDVNILLLYPPAGDQITGNAINAPVSVPGGQQANLTWFGSALDPPPHQWVLGLLPPVGSVYGTSRVQGGTTDTLGPSDCGKTVFYTNSSGTTVTIPAVIVPASGLVCVVAVVQGGSSKVSVNGSTVAAASLVSSNSYTGTSGTQGAIIDLTLTTVQGVRTAYLTGAGS